MSPSNYSPFSCQEKGVKEMRFSATTELRSGLSATYCDLMTLLNTLKKEPLSSRQSGIKLVLTQTRSKAMQGCRGEAIDGGCGGVPHLSFPLLLAGEGVRG